MKIFQRARAALRDSRSKLEKTADEASGEPSHLIDAAQSLRKLLDDDSVPEQVREELRADFEQIEAMIAKLEEGYLHISVFGRVSVGKSALLNALLGREEFEVSPLHGATRISKVAEWQDYTGNGVHLIDTPGINELDGQARERMAYEVADRSDLVLFVADSDLTETEVEALRLLAAMHRPIVLVLNKSDRYTERDREVLLERLTAHASGLVQPQNIVSAAAEPAPLRVVRETADGNEVEELRERTPDVAALKSRIWEILETEGKTLAALNATLFAGKLSDQVAERVAALRRDIAESVIRTYCLAKGVMVALNPIPVADLLAAAGIDVALVRHLASVYGMPMNRRESGKLLATIAMQLTALMGAVWGVNLVSSALKGVSAGLSTAITAGAQGALAYYATYLVGRAAEKYLVAGKSWGAGGPKRAVEQILKTVDRDSILVEAREEILRRLRSSAPAQSR